VYFVVKLSVFSKQGSSNPMRTMMSLQNARGFSLIELMIALTVLAIGLIATSQLFYIAAGSGSLASAKASAAVAAQNRLEYLADLYRQNSGADDLSLGSHGPQQTIVTNPINGAILHRYAISWDVSRVSDPRPGKNLDARFIQVRVTPIQANEAPNRRPSFNKIVNISTIFSPIMR
jgi:prepilin-type N-terminal cleavage/methylation domain-containing protein